MTKCNQTDWQADPLFDHLNCCPLCGCDQVPVLVQRVATERIWQAMVDQLGARFSPDVIAAYAEPVNTKLVRCQHCDLQYFQPLVAGDERFYSELTSTVSRYYNLEKWDFEAALKLIRPGQRVLDIACGSGHFVARASAHGAIAYGVDTNLAAVNQALNLGRSVQAITIEEFALQHQSQFDLVTAFQIIEHLPDVKPLINASVHCLKPGGLLIITVPNRLRRFRDDFEPLDHPPHHLSRWSKEQLVHLAKQHNLIVKAIRFEPANMHDSRTLLRQWVAHRLHLSPKSIPMRVLGRLLCGPILYRLYAAIGLLDYMRLWRMSVMAILQRPLI